MEKWKLFLVAGLLVALGSGCAMFNRASLQYAPSTTFGQELLDLKTAHTEGALTDEEYTDLKKKVISIADHLSSDEDCK